MKPVCGESDPSLCLHPHTTLPSLLSHRTALQDWFPPALAGKTVLPALPAVDCQPKAPLPSALFAHTSLIPIPSKAPCSLISAVADQGGSPPPPGGGSLQRTGAKLIQAHKVPMGVIYTVGSPAAE